METSPYMPTLKKIQNKIEKAFKSEKRMSAGSGNIPIKLVKYGSVVSQNNKNIHKIFVS